MQPKSKSNKMVVNSFQFTSTKPQQKQCQGTVNIINYIYYKSQLVTFFKQVLC